MGDENHLRGGEVMKNIESAAEKFVNEFAPKMFKALDDAQINYDDEMLCHVLSDGFLAGATYERERTKVLVDALSWYANQNNYDNQGCPFDAEINEWGDPEPYPDLGGVAIRALEKWEQHDSK